MKKFLFVVSSVIIFFNDTSVANNTSALARSLHRSTLLNDAKALQQHIAALGGNIDAADKDGRTLLHHVARYGYLKATRLLLAANPDTMLRDKDHKLAFELAAKHNHPAVASVLLEATAGLHMKDYKGWSVLNWAILSGDKERVEDLIAQGAKVGEGCQNALEVCLLIHDMNTFHYLRKLAGVDVPSRRGDTALMSTSHRGDVRIASILLDYGANPNATDDEHGFTALRLSAEEGHTPVVQKLLAHDADPNMTDDFGDTALIWASMRGHTDTVQTLVQHPQTDLNIAGIGGLTALMWASFWGETETAQVLIAAGADPNLTSKSGDTAFSYAKQRGHRSLSKILSDVTHNAQTEETNINEEEVAKILITLANEEDTETLSILLANATDPNAFDKDGDTPLLAATRAGQRASAKILLAYRAFPNIIDKDGYTALLRAAKDGYVELIEPLLERGADPHMTDKEGQTALTLARKNNHPYIVEILEKEGE